MIHAYEFKKGTVGRGVWIMPWYGINGETILISVADDDRAVAFRKVEPGGNINAACDELWDELDRVNPPTISLVG